jgi:hypothetical protein
VGRRGEEQRQTRTTNGQPVEHNTTRQPAWAHDGSWEEAGRAGEFKQATRLCTSERACERAVRCVALYCIAFVRSIYPVVLDQIASINQHTTK